MEDKKTEEVVITDNVSPGTVDTASASERYSCVSRFFHWAIAALVLFQFLKLGDRIADGAHAIGEMIKPFHGSIGVVILVVAIMRLLWNWLDKENNPKTDRHVAIYHNLLYCLLIAVPVSALCLMIGKGYGLKVFGLQLVERSGETTSWMASVGSLHSPLAILMAVMVAGHAFMAIYHHCIKKDNTLKRML